MRRNSRCSLRPTRDDYLENNAMTERKDWWDKSKVIISGITAVGVLLGVCIGYSINKTIGENDLEVRMLLLSLDILRTSPTKYPQDLQREEFENELREWARSIFRDANKKLNRNLSPHLLNQLQTRPLPSPSRSIDWTDIDGKRLPSRKNIDPGAVQSQ